MQISKGKMATVIGIFEENYKKNKPLPVVKPGTQSRRFTHIDDTVEICYMAWKKNLCRHYSISHKKSYTILNVAKFFKRKIVFLKEQAKDMPQLYLIDINRVYKHFGKKTLKII